jgi:hypothetical protein
MADESFFYASGDSLVNLSSLFSVGDERFMGRLVNRLQETLVSGKVVIAKAF